MVNIVDAQSKKTLKFPPYYIGLVMRAMFGTVAATNSRGSRYNVDVDSRGSRPHVDLDPGAVIRRSTTINTARAEVTTNPLQSERVQSPATSSGQLDCVVIEMGTAELTIDDVRLAYASRGDFVMIFLSPLFNMFFFLVFAACALDHTPIQSMFPSENGLANIVAKAGTDAVTTVTTTKFSNMATHHDVFPWLTNTFVPYTFVTTDYNGRNLSTPDLRRVNYVHRILGAVEFKTYSAPPRPCDVVDGPLGAMYAQCHDFDSPVLNSAFYIDAGADPETATAVISAKQASGAWLDASTANLHINLATFNGELNLLCLISLRVTFQPGGFLQPIYQTKCMPSDPYGTSYLAAPLDACVLVLWITTIWMELREWCRDHRRRTGQPPKPRFCTLWRAVTWLSVVSVAVYFAIWTALCVAVYSPTFAADLTALETGASSSQPQLLLVDIMTRLKAMGYLTLSVRIAGMVSLGLLMFRTLSSLRFHPHLNMVTATLTASLHSLVPFCCIFVICLTAFVTSGCLLFGERLLQFSTISRSIITVVNMLFGQFDLAAIFAVDYNIAFTWYWCAMVILFLVLFNMLLAIVLAAFDHVRTVTATKIAPYMAAITELRRLAGPMLWPWNHPHMMQLGSFAESANTGLSTAVTSASIAKQLCVTDVDADIVLRKTRAFLAIMHILRDSNLNDDDVDGEDFVGEGEVAPTSVDVSELNQRLDMMEARLEAKLAAMSVNMAALIARIDAKL